ncbi:MAG: hypothetical protein C4519_21330 [Desulfobacteraceae bacterium]|nr:MAG: hypothetical protein C4519_21330 [Desulfobacteraceae bacterium]
MIADKKTFSLGLILLVTFSAVLVAIFMPLMHGQNGLQYLDHLYNSISKGSANYIPKAARAVESVAGQQIEVTLHMASPQQAEQTARLFSTGGAQVSAADAALKVSGDLGPILSNSLEDAGFMYANNAAAVQTKYGYEARRVLYNWWLACTAMEEALNKQENFKQAALVHTVITKALEPAYNYYGIEPQNIRERLGVVIFSLIFYVVYTLWYGFGIMYLFEGWGMRLEH